MFKTFNANLLTEWPDNEMTVSQLGNQSKDHRVS